MDHSGMMMGHRLFFFTGKENTILFEDWATKTDGEYIGSLAAVFLAAVFTMYLKSVRTGIQKICSPPPTEGAEPIKSACDAFLAPCKRMTACCSGMSNTILLLILTFVIAVFDYCLMLVAMTFEVGLFMF